MRRVYESLANADVVDRSTWQQLPSMLRITAIVSMVKFDCDGDDGGGDGVQLMEVVVHPRTQGSLPRFLKHLQIAMLMTARRNNVWNTP